MLAYTLVYEILGGPVKAREHAAATLLLAEKVLSGYGQTFSPSMGGSLCAAAGGPSRAHRCLVVGPALDPDEPLNCDTSSWTDQQLASTARRRKQLNRPA